MVANSRLFNASSTKSVSAVTVADLGPSPRRLISPKKSPGPNWAKVFPSRLTEAVPLRMIMNSLPTSPSRTTVLPELMLTAVISFLRDFISDLESPEKRGTWFISLGKDFVFITTIHYFLPNEMNQVPLFSGLSKSEIKSLKKLMTAVEGQMQEITDELKNKQ
jgi:hypothetical protein